MAIDPTAPSSPIFPFPPAGTPADAAVRAQAIARQALSDAAARLGEIVGRAADPTDGEKPVGQASQASTQDAGHTADPPSKGATSAPQAPSGAAPETRMARAVRAAAVEAAPRQAGLAPLMANVRALIERSDAPVEVRSAAEALLARTPSAGEIATPQGLRRAIARSGVFLEAGMARAAAAPSSAAPTAATAGVDLKAALLVFRRALSTWLARAAPEIAAEGVPPPPSRAPSSQASPPLPQPARGDLEAPGAPPSSNAGATVSSDARPPDPERPASGQTTPSPAFASATRVEVDGPPPAAASKPPDHEGTGGEPPSPSAPEPEPARTGAQPAAATPRPSETLEPRFAGFTAPPHAPAATVRPDHDALPAVIQLGLLEAEEGARALADRVAPPEAEARVARAYGVATAEARAKAPPPPYAGGPMTGQKPGAPDLPADLPMVDLVRRLLKGASGALARQDLMQIASLPETPHPDGETTEARTQGARLNLDLPFLTPQGVAVAQMEISRDGGGGGGVVAPMERAYRARFSIDVEPLGPVHALVTLSGARARVSLWAERAETIARLRAGEESLGAALRAADLSPEVAVHSGAPPSANGAGPLGHFVDQAS